MSADPTPIRDDGGEQDTYLPPDVPPRHLMAPGAPAFANATWLTVGPEVRRLVEVALSWDEFRELSGIPYITVWRRRTKPMRGEDPVFASIDITHPRVLWTTLQMELRDYPRYSIDLHWQHFEDLREEGMFVHEEVLQQHIHYALSTLVVDNDMLSRRGPDFNGFLKNVERFGAWNSGLAAAKSQLELWQ